MCNDYGNRVGYRELVDAFSEIRLPVVFPRPEAAPNLEPRDEIWPTDPAPVIRPAEGGVALALLRWGLDPERPDRPPVINLRSEGRRFERNRALVPASHFFEFTGKKSPKTRWRFELVGGDWFCFAGLIGRGVKDGEPVEAFALLTTAPGKDVKPYHDRQPVVLPREAWAPWLGGAPAKDLLKPLPAGSLTVREDPREKERAAGGPPQSIPIARR